MPPEMELRWSRIISRWTRVYFACVAGNAEQRALAVELASLMSQLAERKETATARQLAEVLEGMAWLEREYCADA